VLLATAMVAPVDSPTGIGTVTISEVTSASDKLRKRQKSEEIIAKLRQVDVLVSQGESIADATHQIGGDRGDLLSLASTSQPIEDY
jgi:hypothetical protein